MGANDNLLIFAVGRDKKQGIFFEMTIEGPLENMFISQWNIADPDSLRKNVNDYITLNELNMMKIVRRKRLINKIKELSDADQTWIDIYSSHII